MLAAMLAVTVSMLSAVAGGHPAPAPATPPGTTIASLPLQTCADVSTATISGFYGYVYGTPCTGSPAQTFRFTPLTTGPTGTYQIVNASTGQCLIQYATGVKQNACTGSVPADSTNTEWTLTRVGTTGYDYRFVVTTSIATSSPTCLQILPKPRSHPGTVLVTQACDTTQPAQVLTLTSAPWSSALGQVPRQSPPAQAGVCPYIGCCPGSRSQAQRELLARHCSDPEPTGQSLASATRLTCRCL